MTAHGRSVSPPVVALSLVGTPSPVVVTPDVEVEPVLLFDPVERPVVVAVTCRPSSPLLDLHSSGVPCRGPTSAD